MNRRTKLVVLMIFMSINVGQVFAAEQSANIPGSNGQVSSAPSGQNGAISAKNEQSNKATLVKQVASAGFIPPMRGAPARRISGGTRGQEEDTNIGVLAPPVSGYTFESQPVLYWFLSKTSDKQIEFTLIENDAFEPLFETRIHGASAGLHKIELSKYNIKLRPNVEYQWFVSLINNEKQRAEDRVANGNIVYKVPGNDINKSLESKTVNDRVVALLNDGAWYDALQLVNTQLESNPIKQDYQKLQATLLGDAGLADVFKPTPTSFSNLQ